MTPKERPILFSAPMVRAILEGRKTQTRRVMNPQPFDRGEEFPTMVGLMPDGRFSVPESVEANRLIFCPHGQPGDRLWVRETWCCKMEDGQFLYDAHGNHLCHYAADGYEVIKTDGDGGMEMRKDGRQASPWKPSIHMPRWASRLTLEIMRIRVERLQDISGEDAISEGWPSQQELFPTVNRMSKAKDWYERLWDSLNAERGFGWDKNPWVWVIEFKLKQEGEK